MGHRHILPKLFEHIQATEPRFGVDLKVRNVQQKPESLGVTQVLTFVFASAALNSILGILSLFEDALHISVYSGASNGSHPRVGFVGL